MIMTNYTKGDRTILYDDTVYDIMIWSNPIHYNSFVEKYEKRNKYYIDDANIMYSMINNVCRPQIRLLFDDGG